MITIPWGNKKGMLQLDGKTGFWGVEFSGVKLHHLEAAVKGADAVSGTFGAADGRKK